MTEHRVIVAGETLVDFIPATCGPLADVETFDRRAGGAPANVAVGLTRLGEPPWLCSTISTDPFGDFLAGRLASEGVPDRFLTRVDRPTALAFVSHDAEGDREFSFYREGTADVHFETDAVDENALAAADWLVVGGVTLTVEPARSATVELVERARDAGCRVAFDPNTREELWSEDPTPTLERMLALIDLLKTTRDDFEPTTLASDDDGFARRLLNRGPDTVLLTEGAAGATVVAGPDSPWGAGQWSHPGYDPESVVDTTGAGDAFLAGAVAALADGASPTETLAFANAVATLTTTESGAMAALPSEAAVKQFMEART